MFSPLCHCRLSRDSFAFIFAAALPHFLSYPIIMFIFVFHPYHMHVFLRALYLRM